MKKKTILTVTLLALAMSGICFSADHTVRGYDFTLKAPPYWKGKIESVRTKEGLTVFCKPIRDDETDLYEGKLFSVLKTGARTLKSDRAEKIGAHKRYNYFRILPDGKQYEKYKHNQKNLYIRMAKDVKNISKTFKYTGRR